MIVRNLLNRGYYGYKIPDPPQGAIDRSAKRPFDLFGCTPSKTWFVECKFVRGESNFPFDSVREHQYEALLKIAGLASKNTLSFVMVGFWSPRKWLKIVSFDIQFLANLREKSIKKSISKKAIQYYLNNEKYHVDVIKKEFHPLEIERKIIYGSD